MSQEIYRPLMEDMIWSYSRLSTFHDCPYRWFLRYIRDCKEAPQFYSSYGSFMHRLIEEFYKGELTKEGMLTKFLFDFQKEVQGERPKESTVQKYISSGLKYLKGFTPFPYNMIDVEKKVRFNIEGVPFVGFIDYLGESDGDLIIVDNKSRDLKPRSKRKEPTVKDKELDDMFRQLYIYSAAVKQEYGRFPKLLCFNCFKSGVFIEEPFDKKAYDEAIKWAIDTVNTIKDTNDFPSNVEFFACQYICGVKDDCCYYEMR